MEAPYEGFETSSSAYLLSFTVNGEFDTLNVTFWLPG